MRIQRPEALSTARFHGMYDPRCPRPRQCSSIDPYIIYDIVYTLYIYTYNTCISGFQRLLDQRSNHCRFDLAAFRGLQIFLLDMLDGLSLSKSQDLTDALQERSLLEHCTHRSYALGLMHS